MIKVKIVADSICAWSRKRIATFEIEYPRFILAEVNTHKMLSKNSSSSRAIPISSVIEMIKESPAMPIHWGKNQSGMQSDGEISREDIEAVRNLWRNAAEAACDYAEALQLYSLHKEVVNRILEPFQIMKTVITGTEWANMFYLRNHPDAQPEFQMLAAMMEKALEDSTPVILEYDEWHMPYYGEGFWKASDYAVNRRTGHGLEVVDRKHGGHTLREALMISSSCSAQVSFRKSDDTLEKAERVFGMLNIGSKEDPAHGSPTEHQGTPIKSSMTHLNNLGSPETWQKGVTAYHKELGFMSGNLAGWIQYRQTLPNHTVW